MTQVTAKSKYIPYAIFGNAQNIKGSTLPQHVPMKFKSNYDNAVQFL